MKIGEHLAQATRGLGGCRRSRLEAEVLLGHALDVERSFLYAHPELEVPAPRARQFDELLKARRDGRPIAYLTGQREFWSLPLRITPDVLIPRPETELLVEAALARVPAHCHAEDGCRVLELGTGSGAIALALASERPDWHITASDTSAAALAVAHGNAQSLNLNDITFLRSDWFAAIDGHYHLIVSNPPYVAADDVHLREGDCRFEPRAALTPGDDGLTDLRHIAAHAPDHLHPGGWLMLEHGYDQGTAVQALLHEQQLAEIATLKDDEDRDRITIGRRLSA